MTKKEMKKLTLRKFVEREKFMIEYLKDHKISLKYLRKVNAAIIKYGNLHNPSIGYCGGGNSGDKHESLSSICIPDGEAKNWSCYYHDELEALRELTEDKLLTWKEVKRFFEASCKFDEDDIIDTATTPLYVFFGTMALKFRSWFS